MTEQEHNNLHEEFDKFHRASVQVLILVAQLLAVLAAVFLCSVWWHYVILALVCLIACPMWGNAHASAQARWWKQHAEKEDAGGAGPGGMMIVQTVMVDPEANTDALISRFDNLEQSVPPPTRERNWPFNKGRT